MRYPSPLEYERRVIDHSIELIEPTLKELHAIEQRSEDERDITDYYLDNEHAKENGITGEELDILAEDIEVVVPEECCPLDNMCERHEQLLDHNGL